MLSIKTAASARSVQVTEAGSILITPFARITSSAAMVSGWIKNRNRTIVPLPALFTRSFYFHHSLSTTSSATRATKSLQ
jgi:hypothetical protein